MRKQPIQCLKLVGFLPIQPIHICQEVQVTKLPLFADSHKLPSANGCALWNVLTVNGQKVRVLIAWLKDFWRWPEAATAEELIQPADTFEAF